MTQFNTIAFRVFASPDTNDHEVRILIDGSRFIAEHWPDMMGMDPVWCLGRQARTPAVRIKTAARILASLVERSLVFNWKLL